MAEEKNGIPEEWRQAIQKMWERPAIEIDPEWAAAVNRALKMAVEKENG